MRRTHWFGEDVETIDTTLDRVPALLPIFERYGLGRNRFLDMISCRSTTDYWSMASTPEGATLINRCDEAQTYEARLAAGTLPKR